MSDNNKKDKKKEDERPKVSIFKVIKFGLTVNVKYLPSLFIAINIIAVVHGISHGFATFVTQGFYDSVGSVITNNGPVSCAYLMIAALGLTFIVKEVLNGVHNFMHGVVFSKSDGEMAKIIHGKMARIDPVCLEDTKLHDDIEKAAAGAGTATLLQAGSRGMSAPCPPASGSDDGTERFPARATG